MNQAKLKTYRMQTTPAIPGYVRPPTTLFEHFRADPRGAATFKEWTDDRVVEFLQHRCIIQEQGQRGVWFDAETWPNLGRALVAVYGWWESDRLMISPPAYRVALLDGTIIKEWLPETKDSATVAKT